MHRKQVVLNIGANFISTTIGLLISFLLTPFIVNNLGAEAYSFLPISSNFTAYMAIMTTALTTMTSRFVTIKVHQNDLEAANVYYSTSFYTNTVLAAIVFIIFGLIVFYLPSIVNIPVGILWDVRLLFIFMFLTFITNLLQTNFGVPAFCMNRLDVSSIISIVGSVTRVGVLLVCFAFFTPRIFYIGLATWISALCMLFINVIASLKIMPQLRIKFALVKVKVIGELFSSGIWNSINQLSAVLLTGLDILIANIMLGVTPSGLLAVAKTAPIALQTLVNILPTTFFPFLTILYARETRENYLKELILTTKYSSLILSIPIAGFTVLASDFLKIWVPTLDQQLLTELSLLTMVSLIASFSVLPMKYIFTITNKLKWASLAIFLTGILNVLIVLIFITRTNFGLYAIAGVSSVLEILRSLIFIPLYAAYCLDLKKGTFYPVIIKSLLNIGLLLIIYGGIVYFWEINNWISLIACTFVFVIIGIVSGVLFMLNQNEKMKLISLVKSKFS